MPFSTLQEKDLFGRKEELTELYHSSLGADTGAARSIFLSGPRGIGKTEILKQLFNHLFWKQDRVVPFYYTVNNALLSASDFSRDYLTCYICQRLAFENKEQALIHLDGLSTQGLAALVEERQAAWAQEILDRFIRSSDSPRDQLRVALSAPHQSALSIGKPVVIMIDEFQRLNHLHIGDAADSRLASLFEVPLSYPGTPHVITGCELEIQEMPVAGLLARMHVNPLGREDASQMFLSLLRASGATVDAVPHTLVRCLGGNPFYIRCVAKAAGGTKTPDKDDLWRAYLREITGGTIYLYWSSIVKSFFPDLAMRRAMLEITRKIHRSDEPLTEQKVSTSLPASGSHAESALQALHRAGLVRGEFGVFRIPEDRVVVDFMNCLYAREVLGKNANDIGKEFLEQAAGPPKKGCSVELTLPMIKDAELIAARCLEQIGRNLHLGEETIGQMQIAVVEACINALEYGKGEDNKVGVRFEFDKDHLMASIESAGREFVLRETGEPFEGLKLTGDSGRGWGIKLMKRFMDSVRFEKTARGTAVVLTKYLSQSADVQKEAPANSE
jgi:anti-sigma regulatory factor (Ser/Thr protein kinase)